VEGMGAFSPWAITLGTMLTMNMRMIRRALVILLATVFLFCVSWQLWIHLSYSANMPRSPEPDTGRIYRVVVNHGAEVYVTRAELNWCDFAQNETYWIEFSILGLLGYLRVRYKNL